MPTIKKPNQYFDATLYTGTGSTQSITNAGAFKPDAIWIKTRSAGAYNHHLVDSVRGANKNLRPNVTGAEDTTTDQVTAFNSNGFSLGVDTAGPADSEVNVNGNTYVAWQWQAGSGTTTVNTSGSISSNVSVNTTAGFSIGTFTSPASGTCSVGHGLGVKPAMTIVKCRSVGNSGWFVWHQALGDNNTDYLSLQSTAAESSFSTMWGTVGRTSTLLGFTQGGSLEANATHVFYAWAEVEGFSKFGSYVANASSDGPFIYTGFRPRWIMFKRTTSSTNWYVIDTSISSYNASTSGLYPNTTDAVSSEGAVDILSNGFKCRVSSGAFNYPSGETFMYAAFAESPFKYSNAR